MAASKTKIKGRQVALPRSTPRNPFEAYSAFPKAQGLYNPAHEKDSCGLAAIATLHGSADHGIVEKALTALRRMEHRGAVGADEGSGDGAGILSQVPHDFFKQNTSFNLPGAGDYIVGTAFLPQNAEETAIIKENFTQLAAAEDLEVLGWRGLPTKPEAIGPSARSVMPRFEQIFMAVSQKGRKNPQKSTVQDLESKAFRIRKRAQNLYGVYFPSLSSRTIVYKGMLSTAQLEPFYPDLMDPQFKTKLAIVHSRFSTNTFPSWPLAQPFRLMAHNGEINTIKGNRNWMYARQSQFKSPVLGYNSEELYPICTVGASDSASLDEVAELLLLSGRSIAHVLMMMIPEAWENHEAMDPNRKAFYKYHSMLMEAWDGPASIAFTDGNAVGATLDRNGLRPGRYWVTDDGLVIFGSEVGIVDVDPARVTRRGRVAPGKMFMVDTQAGRIIEDEEIKTIVSQTKPWRRWTGESLANIKDLPEREDLIYPASSINVRQRTFGYTSEELRILLAPMARFGTEPLGAMGNDTPVAVLSERPQLFFDYFVQNFAQVTNPPLDAIREELVTSMRTVVGPSANLLSIDQVPLKQYILTYPVIDNKVLAKLSNIQGRPFTDGQGRHHLGEKLSLTVRGLYNINGGATALRKSIKEICEKVAIDVERGMQFVVLSDRDSNARWAPIPSLLLLSAVHHHLLRRALRTKCALIVEAGDVLEVHHVAVLLGYGASAVNPYLAMESVQELVRTGEITEIDPQQAASNLLHALGKGTLKIMSKMGISTVASYCGAQTFEALGLSQELIDEYFSGTKTQLGGIGLEKIEEEVAARHRLAYPEKGVAETYRPLETGGEYQWRRDGAPHLFNPTTVFRLQHSTRERRYDVFKAYTHEVNEQSKQLMTIRGLMQFKTGIRPSIAIEEVEPASEIVKRFSTGAMSYGSISQEAHETLAVAMNQLGAKSNTGEGGEDIERLLDPKRRSAIKQVASGRFGVTSMYLSHADDIQIKIAQGAKPGEGGQLMSQKVYPWVAKTRHSTPGVSLISPPPHHDIYSIEDLAQLIYDLKRSSPKARIHVKLVSESGVGTVATGVAKAKADVILISGHDGGTGAAPLNSLKHAGMPWELGLAEAQQTLRLNGLRNRVTLQTDGQLKTGRDVVVAALLGAEEYGFATTTLVVSGCVMMRVCHLDTCPVGVATQNPLLRERFTGKPEFVINFMEFVAEEVREILAELGFRSLEEAIGQVEILDVKDASEYWKTSGMNIEPLLTNLRLGDDNSLKREIFQDHELDRHIDNVFIASAEETLKARKKVTINAPVTNADRAVGTLLGSKITQTFGVNPLEQDSIVINLEGSAGQSLGAFLPRGITIKLFGDANDYTAKGLSGGRICLAAPLDSKYQPHRNIIAGNVIGYGATSGEIYISGVVGERFLVRNSGAHAVVEGVGDHALEYMTGGVALVIGEVGRNFGAGMTGGVGYVLDLAFEKVNKQALAQGELELLELDAEDELIVHQLLERHRQYTGSALALRLLRQFEKMSHRIIKVLPRDYAKVLQLYKKAEKQGKDPKSVKVWHEILEVTGG